MARKTLNSETALRAARLIRIYTLEVALLSGPKPKQMAEQDSVVSRTLQLRGDQTLADLHQAISDAFGQPPAHLYEFQCGVGPFDEDGPRYLLPGAYEVSVADGTPAAGRVDQITLDALTLKVGRRFACWTDGGDDRWYQIDVRHLEKKTPRGRYPKVTKRIGQSPPSPSPSSAPAKADAAAEPGISEAADAACLVGELHLSKGDYRKAVDAFTRAIEEHPTADAYEGRAAAYRALAAVDEAAAQQGW